MQASLELNLGRLALAQMDYTQARQLLQAALQTYHESGDLRSQFTILELLAEVAAKQAQPALGLCLAGATATHRTRLTVFASPPERVALENALNLARQALDDEDAVTAWAEGERMSLEQVVAYALESNEADFCSKKRM